MDKKNIIIIGVAVLLLLILLTIFIVNRNFLTEEPLEEEIVEEEQIERMTEEEEYIVSLSRGMISELEKEYIIVETEPFGEKIKVNIKKDTEFITYRDERQPKVSIPDEYQNSWFSRFYYLKHEAEEDYLIYIYFDTEEDLGEDKLKGILDFNEVNATYIAWQCYLKNLNEN